MRRMRYIRRVGAVRLLTALALCGGCDFRIAPVTGGAFDNDGSGFPGGDGGAAADDLAGGVGDDFAHAGPFLQLASVLSPAAVDLTVEGTSDWAHWGYASARDFDHKTSGNTQISDFSSVGVNVPTRYGDNLVTYRWSDGSGKNGGHDATPANGTTSGVLVLTGGFKITAPADPKVRRLRVYVGQYNAQGQLDVSLGDSSAPAVSDHAFTSSSGKAVNVEYIITYAAATPGQTLEVRWTVLQASFGNVTLQSATLQEY